MKIELYGGHWYEIQDQKVIEVYINTSQGYHPVTCEQVQVYVDRGFPETLCLASCLKATESYMNEDAMMLGELNY